MDSSLARDWSFLCRFFRWLPYFCVLQSMFLHSGCSAFAVGLGCFRGEPRPRYERTTDEVRTNHDRSTGEPRTRYERTTTEVRANHGRCVVAKGVLSYNEKGVPVLPERLSRVVKVFSGGYFLKPMTRRTSFIVACALALATSAPSSAILSSSCGLALYSRIFSLIGATIAHKSCAICFFRSP